MAKSKSGGTRSYLRGRIASDVYSIGRDANGKKQQVVRSLAEQVKNPQTIAQMRGRMIMSTVMQAVSGLAPLIDHSFDNVPNGQPSISEFIRSNYALLKADVAAHPDRNNFFGLNAYQQKGIMKGAWLVSKGKVATTELIGIGSGSTGSVVTIMPATETPTIQDFLDLAFGGKYGFLTAVGILDGVVRFARFSFSKALEPSTAVTADNLSQVLEIDNPLGIVITPSIQEGQVAITFGEMLASTGIIYSVENGNGGYEHSTTTLSSPGQGLPSSDTVLPTYPVGEERFLNGGEL